MRNTNCRNVRREIEEATPGEMLSSSVKDHLMNCIACETFSREQSKLQQIVSSLGTVEAPGDFDFRLRARLAGEKPGSANAFSAMSIGGLSFGLPSLAGAALVFLVGLGLVFVSLKSQSTNSLTAGAGASGKAQEVVKSGATDVTPSAGGNQEAVAVGSSTTASGTDHSPVKRRNPRIEAASPKDRNTVATDFSSTGARVLTPDSQLAGTYPTSAFPIDASYQSVKVSVDNGRGASRTISLPSVSFGSNQSLSQNESQLMASTRGAW